MLKLPNNVKGPNWDKSISKQETYFSVPSILDLSRISGKDIQITWRKLIPSRFALITERQINFCVMLKNQRQRARRVIFYHRCAVIGPDMSRNVCTCISGAVYIISERMHFFAFFIALYSYIYKQNYMYAFVCVYYVSVY